MARHLRVEYPGAIYHVTCRLLEVHAVALAKDRPLRRQIKEIEERLENARCARASP